MPQFDTATFASQLFWFGLFFAVLYFAVVRPTLPKVGRVIDAREAQVAGDLDKAEAARGAADAIRTAYDEAIRTAQDSAALHVNAARDAAARTVEAQVKALSARLEAEAAAATDRLATVRNAARAALAQTMADLTSDAVARVAGISITADEAASALASTGRETAHG